VSYALTGKLSSPGSGNINTSRDVAVKMLKDDVSGKSTKEDFEHEAKTISSFDHENILHLIGLVVVGKPMYNFIYVVHEAVCVFVCLSAYNSGMRRALFSKFSW